jgi:hypothetical protein
MGAPEPRLWCRETDIQGLHRLSWSPLYRVWILSTDIFNGGRVTLRRRCSTLARLTSGNEHNRRWSCTAWMMSRSGMWLGWMRCITVRCNGNGLLRLPARSVVNEPQTPDVVGLTILLSSPSPRKVRLTGRGKFLSTRRAKVRQPDVLSSAFAVRSTHAWFGIWMPGGLTSVSRADHRLCIVDDLRRRYNTRLRRTTSARK